MREKEKDPRITYERLKEVANYNTQDGVFTWKIDIPKVRKKIGDRMGHFNYPHGHPQLIIKIDKKSYSAGKLAWFYVHGEWPSGFIYYKDGNRLNIKLDNLTNKYSESPLGKNIKKV